MSGEARFPDVVVVGGGIIGAACGYYLAREGLSVHLLERSFLASGTSGACEGNLLSWDKEMSKELPFGRRSFQLWRQLVDELEIDFEYQPKGSVMVAENGLSLAAVEQKVRDLSAAGVPGQMLDPKQLHEEEPALAGDLVGGALFPEDGQVEPRYATAALAEGGRRHGLVVRQDCSVRRIALSPKGRVEAVETTAGRIPTAAVVIAAGV
jgi:glycine/D-amino acid oxidase-like deaminating enzyme